jgi:hypothetical protein
MSLAQRVAAADLAGLPDWRVAELLNIPDPTLPEIVTLEQTLLGPAGIMVVLGPDGGARVMSVIEALAAQDAKMRWVLYILQNGGIDTAHVFIRDGLDGLAAAQVITAADAQTLKATAERRRFPSWAEHNQTEVTPRSVGLARGAKE